MNKNQFNNLQEQREENSPLHPQQAIDQMCLICSRGSMKDVLTCDHKACPLFRHKLMGKGRKTRHNLQRMQAIRDFCTDCSGGDEEQVKTCEPLFKFYPEVDCPLWTRRSGKLFKENGKYPEYRGMPYRDLPIKPKQEAQSSMLEHSSVQEVGV